MKINDYKGTRHLAARLEIGVDDALCLSRVGQHATDILATMIPGEEITLPKPVFTPWEEIAGFHDHPIEVRREIVQAARLEARQLTTWWLEQIRNTQYPLLERMTIFWHNHFTSDATKVVWPQFMYRQNQLLRKHALGNFADLLHEIARDPAMLIYLDSRMNVAGQPNENFARELLELFTLGEGHYSEADVANVARAFTGWSLDFDAGEFTFIAGRYDDGAKDFMGRSADLNGEDIINILLNIPRTAEYIAEKFWAEFINHNEPDPVTIQAWAEVFRDSGYEITALLNEVVHSQAFWDATIHGTMIKSPVELSVGLMRELKLQLDDFDVLRRANLQLGQDLFYPPDVKGWRGGLQWIDSNRLVRRYDLIAKLLATHDGDEQNMLKDRVKQPDMTKTSVFSGSIGMFSRLFSSISCTAGGDELVEWLLPTSPVFTPNCIQPLTQQLTLLLKDPAYQLK